MTSWVLPTALSTAEATPEIPTVATNIPARNAKRIFMMSPNKDPIRTYGHRIDCDSVAQLFYIFDQPIHLTAPFTL
jgi:hypothetical protein